MAEKDGALREIRTILAYLYTRTSDVVRVAEDAGLDLAFIQFNDKPVNVWRDILSEADRRNKIEDVISIAVKDYQENEKLKSAYQTYLNAVQSLRKIDGKKLSRIQVNQPPNVNLDTFQSILFQEYGQSARIRSGIPALAMSIDAVYEIWNEEDSTRPLILICDFAPDIQPTLFALTAELGLAHWLRGETLFGLNSQESHQTTGMVVDLSEELPAVLFIDFSEIRLGSILSSPTLSESPSLSESISAFCSLADSYGHRVVVGIPRFLQALLDINEFINGSVTVFSSAELFSYQYRNRIDQCQDLLRKTRSTGFIGRLLGKDRIDGGVLPPLLSANSHMLQVRVAEFLSTLPEDITIELTPTNLSQLPILLELANDLANHGFYEIAYRLETYCLALQKQDLNLITLDADIDLEPQRQNYAEQIKGLINGLEKTPVVIGRGSLTGESGSGKTTGLLQIKQYWSLPHTNIEGIVHPLWVTLSVVTSRNSDLASQIQDSFRQHQYIDDRHDRYRLSCHALFSNIASPTNLRWLFSSPIYLLVDGIDELPVEQQSEIEKELQTLLDMLPDAGYLLALRTGETAQFANLPCAQIRPLSNYQFKTFLRNNGIHQSWSSLLGVNEQSIARYLRNPYLLNLVGRIVTIQGNQIKLDNLSAIFQAHIADVSQRVQQTIAYRITEEWLPDLALKMKAEGLSTIKLKDEKLAELLTVAQQMEILRRMGDKRTVRFQQQLLQDFFTAKQLSREINTHGVQATISCYLAANQTLHFWRDVLKFLSSLLDSKQIEQLIEYIRNRGDLHLALECLLEIPLEQSRQISNRVVQKLVSRIESHENGSISQCIRDAEVLSFLDPRIFIDDPVAGMTDIHPSEGVPDFKISRYPVTNIEFAKFINAGGYNDRSLWSEASWQWLRNQNIRYPLYWQHASLNKPNHPVVGISVYEALAYCNWLSSQYPEISFTLPSVAQWDNAAHGIETGFDQLLEILRKVSQNEEQLDLLLLHLDEERAYPHYREEKKQMISNQIISHVQAYMAQYKSQIEYYAVTPVGIFPPNGQKCYDLFGNVWEWTRTWLTSDESDETNVVEKPIKRGDMVIVKGGTWAGTYSPIWSVMDGWIDPFVRFHELGFRLCCT